MSRDPTQLVAASEHIFYEVWMAARLKEVILPRFPSDSDAPHSSALSGTTHTTQAHVRFTQPPRPSNSSQELMVVNHNALIEAFALHARTLVEFFYFPESPRFPDDIRADHYFPEPATWHAIRPGANPDWVDELTTRVGKEIAHLTYRRQMVNPADKPWRIVDISEQLESTTACFLRSVDRGLLHPIWSA